MSDYMVSFEIDVTADNPEEAVKEAWRLLSGKDAMLPVGDAIEGDGEKTRVDLQELKDKENEHN